MQIEKRDSIASAEDPQGMEALLAGYIQVQVWAQVQVLTLL